MADADIDKVIEGTNAALSDLYEFNRLLWTIVMGTLEEQSVVKKGTFEAVLETAAKIGDDKPGQVSEMLRGVVENLRDPETPPRRWTPEIIRGGKE